ncbi:hypothetical protein CARUB_v10015696mg, partial [Capsella rubella]
MSGKEVVKSESSRVMSAAYQLAANENPGAIIAHVHFNGDNFDEWAQTVRTALRVKKKFGFVDGSVTEPNKEEAEYEDWVSAKSMTLGNKEDPAELWKEIKDRFCEGNGPRIQEIKAELALCRQGYMRVIDYYGKLQVLWEDLSNYETPVVCNCGGCTCEINAKLEKKKEEDRIHHFLLGLDEAVFGGMRTLVIGTDPLPNMNQVYSKVKSVERVNTVMRGRGQQPSQVAFVAQTGNATVGYKDKSKLVCTALVQAEGESSAEAEKNGFTGLTNEQWGTLIKLLSEKQGTEPRLNGKSFSLDWVLDTGASNHMTGFSELLVDQ